MACALPLSVEIILHSLDEDPLSAYRVRQAIITAISSTVSKEQPQQKKRCRTNILSCSSVEELLAEGFPWVAGIRSLNNKNSNAAQVNSVPSLAGGAEFFHMCSQLIKGGSNVFLGIILQMLQSCGRGLWLRCDALFLTTGSSSGGNISHVDQYSKVSYAVALLILIRRCVKRIAATEQVCLIFEPWPDMELRKELEEEQINLYIPSPALIFGQRSLHKEVQLKGLDLYVTILQHPHVQDGLGRGIIHALDHGLRDAAVDTGQKSLLAGTSKLCGFIDPRCLSRQQAQRALVLWAHSLRSVVCREKRSHWKFVWEPCSPQVLLVSRCATCAPTIAASLAELLADNDQYLVQVFCDITVCAQRLKEDYPVNSVQATTIGGMLVEGSLQPWSLFQEFCHSFHHDERLLLDLLVSNETIFLEYCIAVLKLPWEKKAESVLRRLYDSVLRAHDHGCFLYDPTALLRRFEAYFSQADPPLPPPIAHNTLTADVKKQPHPRARLNR